MSPSDAEIEDLERRAAGGCVILVVVALLVVLLVVFGWYLWAAWTPDSVWINQ